jgi:Tol biopolymer transport system component
MFRGLPRGASLHLIFLFLFTPSLSHAHDPSLRWWTLETPHFRIHYHEGTYHLAVKVAQNAEMSLDRISAILQHLPTDPIELVIADWADTANGSAQVIPYNIVHVLASAPENLSVLNDYDDYIQILLRHELVHIVHMDTVSGLPAAINWIFGRSAYPNGAQPVWFIEGLAVHFESSLSSAGRIRSSLFRMYLRTTALAGVFPGLDQVSGLMQEWPQGTAPYLYGAFFVDYLARRYGDQALSDLSHHMGGMLVPWTLNVVARRELGTDYVALWDQWKESVIANVRQKLALLEAEGLTSFRHLTHGGQHQRCPRVSPGSGQVLYYSAPTNRWPALRAVAKDGTQDRILFEVNNDGGAAFTPDGRRIVYSQREVSEQFYVYNDLYRFDLETGKTLRLTRRSRARSPDVSPDGQRIVYAHNRAGRTQIALCHIDGSRARDLTRFDDGTQVYTPRFSPDGGQVIFSATTGVGGRNLWLLCVETKTLRRITTGRFMDVDPVFAPGGREVIFSSDRTGIYNLYSLDLKTEKMVRLTNLATGAFSPDPSPDKTGIAFMVYGKDGYDIAWLDLPLRERPAQATRETRPPPPYRDNPSIYPSRPYRPWSTLWPRSWFPVFGEDPYGGTYGILVGGRDVLGKLDYRAQFLYGPGENQLYFDAGVYARVMYPSLSLYASRHVYRYHNHAFVNGVPWPVDKERITLFADLAFPFSRYRENHYIFFNYDLHLYERWTQLPRDPMDLQPYPPDDRRLAWVSAGWAFSSVRSFTHSISQEEGLYATVSLRFSHPTFGSESKVTEARFGLRTYFPIVRDRHHVLALGLRGGIAVGDPARRSVFSIGGLPISDPVSDAYFGYRYSGLYLRGYRPGAFAGSIFVLGSAEYRLPLLDIEAGFLSLPFYLRRLHAAVFVDVGGVSMDELSTDMLKVGIGAELRLDMLLAYYLPFTLRLGYGRGLSEEGENNFFLTMGLGF